MKYFNFPSFFSNRYFQNFVGFVKNAYVKKILLIFLLFLAQIEIDTLVFSYSLALVLPLFIYYVVAESRMVSFWFLIYIVLLFESYTFLPFGYYMCLYFTLWFVLSTTRDFISWQNPFTLFLVSIGVNLWVAMLQMFLLVSRELVDFVVLTELGVSFLVNSTLAFIFFLFLLSKDYWFLRNMR